MLFEKVGDFADSTIQLLQVTTAFTAMYACTNIRYDYKGGAFLSRSNVSLFKVGTTICTSDVKFISIMLLVSYRFLY